MRSWHLFMFFTVVGRLLWQLHSAAKKRGFCPSCCAKCMADAATHLTDNVVSLALYRKFIVSFPIPMRHWLNNNCHFASQVNGVVTKAIHRQSLGRMRSKHGARLQTVLALVAITCACARGQSSATNAAPVTSTTVETSKAGATEVGSATETAPTTSATNRTTALPPDTGLDPRTYIPSADYVPGLGRQSYTFTANRIHVVDSEPTFVHPPCTNQLPLSSAPTLTPTLDGKIDEWRINHLAAIDRAGDGIVAADGHTYDLRAVYYAEDDAFVYVAAQIEKAWPTVDKVDTGRFIFEIAAVAPSGLEPTVAPREFHVSGPAVYEWRVDKWVDLTKLAEPTVIAAVADKSVEIRIAKSEIAAHRAATYHRWFFRVGYNTSVDFGGTHLLGFTDVYRCVVELPGRTIKLFTMRRTPDTDTSEADRYFRGAIAAAGAVEHALGHRVAHLDSIAFTYTNGLSASYIVAHHGLMWLASPALNSTFRSQIAAPVKAFETAIHEYAHLINGKDLRSPAAWFSEGHSDWASLRAFESYYGIAAANTHAHALRGKLHDIEATNQPQLLEPWTGEQYAKAMLLFDTAEGLSSANDLRAMLTDIANGTIQIPTSAAARDAFTGLPGLSGAPIENLWSGWFSGPYVAGTPLTDGQIDADGDGLLRYQERRHGTADTKADTDGDGISDIFELGVGRNPLVAESDWPAAIYADGLLGDWATVAPAALRAAPAVSGAGCGAGRDLARVGALNDGKLLVIGVQLGSAISKGTEIKSLIAMPGEGSDYVISANEGHAQVNIWHNGVMLGYVVMAAPLTSVSTEFALPVSMIAPQATGGLPAGTTVKVETWTKELGRCDYSESRTPDNIGGP